MTKFYLKTEQKGEQFKQKQRQTAKRINIKRERIKTKQKLERNIVKKGIRRKKEERVRPLS